MTARVIEAVAAERERTARALHDEAVQSISAAALRVELVRAAVGAELAEVEELRETLRDATRQIRSVMDGLRRPDVGRGDLGSALRSRLAAAYGPAGIHVIDDLVRDPPEPVGLALHWVAEEAVRALRTAGGFGAITVTLRSPAQGFEAEVAAATVFAQTHGSVELDEVHRLAMLAGGASSLDETRPAVTKITTTVPWDGERPP